MGEFDALCEVGVAVQSYRKRVLERLNRVQRVFVLVNALEDDLDSRLEGFGVAFCFVELVKLEPVEHRALGQRDAGRSAFEDRVGLLLFMRRALSLSLGAEVEVKLSAGLVADRKLVVAATSE